MEHLADTHSMIMSTVVFGCAFLMILSEKVDKTIVALTGAVVLLLLGIFPLEEAVSYIDFHTILLLMGMMIIVHIMRAAHLFQVTAIHLARITKGNPLYIFLIFCWITAIFSAFLDNVTTILVIVPITIQLTAGMGINPVFFILGEIFLSNIGGTATLIGDPPNILIGSAAGFSFTDFLYMLTVPVVITVVLVTLYLVWKKWETVRPCNDNFQRLFTNNLMLENLEHTAEDLVVDKVIIYKVLTVFGITLLGFFTHAVTHIPASIIAVGGALLLMAVTNKEFHVHEVLMHIEWSTLLFFAGLFIIVGGLEHTGVLIMISNGIISLSDDILILSIIILWSSAIFSSVVDNIPFVAVMIPILGKIIAEHNFGVNVDPTILWWALSLGACFGGNGTMLGASANVVAIEITKHEKIPITFLSFLRWSIPVTFISLVVASFYLMYLIGF